MHGTLPKLPAKPPAELRTSARRRGAARRPVTHIALPGYEVGRVEPRRRETITALLRRTGWVRRDAQFGWQFRNGLPTILTVNGEPVLRKRWRFTRIGVADVIQFVSRPLGGQGGSSGTKQVIGLVALVAVAAFAAFVTGGAAAGVIPGLFGAGSFSAAALGAGIAIGGSLLINTLINPKPGATNDPHAKTDQIYTASATGNLPKLGQPLPVGYGREKRYPDFAATPWGEFVANDQYQNILLSVGLGRYDYEQLYIDDTPFWNPTDGVAPAFSSAQIAFYDPGEQIALFPASVSSSSEVTGQQLPHGAGVVGHYGPTGPGAWLGGYVAAPSGTVTQSLAIDFVFPAGCFWLNKNTAIPLTVGLRAEYRTVNDAGAPTGGWTELFDVQRSYNSKSPIRDSIKIDVAAARYEVRFRRNDDVPLQTEGASDVLWAGLRAYLQGENSFPVSTIAIRIKGTESTQGAFKFGAVRTRILPVWDAGTATFIDQPTRNPAWAFLDAVANEEYGSGHSLSKVDFNAVLSHAAGCDARDDHFDYTFDSAAAVPETLDKILMPSRARHFWLGDTISVVRDEWRDVPSMLLTDREIVRDSTQITWTMLGEEDPDAVIVEYMDEETWRPAQVQYPPEVAGIGGFHATQAETKRIDGIVNRDHAYREAAFLYLQSIYRRENVQIATEYEGRAITFGSVLRVQSELPMAFGYGGAVIDRTGNSLTLNPAPSWADAGNHYIRLRRPNGKWFGPILTTRGASDAIAVLDSGQLATAVSTQGVTLSDTLAREDGGEDPSFDFGTADNQSRLCVVLSGQPNGNQCTLNLVVDDIRVHATDLGNPPVLPTVQFPADLTAPVIAGLNASFGQGIAEPKLSASWFPAAGAFYYVAEVSYDDGANWIQVYEGRDNQFTALVLLAALTLRVQAVGKLHGPYSQIELGAPTIEIAAGTVALNSLVSSIQYQVTKAISAIEERVAEAEDIIDTLGNELSKAILDRRVARGEIYTARHYLEGINFDTRTTLTSRIDLVQGEAQASIEEVRDIAVGTEASFSAYTITTNATLGGVVSQVATDSVTLSTLVGSFSTYQISVTSQFGALTSSITNESDTRATADSTLSFQMGLLNSTIANNTASIANEQITRADADTAFASSLTTLNTAVGGNTSAISAEAIARASADSSLAGQITSLTTTVGGNTSAITAEQIARSSADGALAASIASISVAAAGNNRQINPRWANGFTGWPFRSPNWYTDSYPSADGTWSFCYDPATSTGLTAYMFGDLIPWGASTPIGLSGKRLLSYGVTAGLIYTCVICYDAAGTFIGAVQYKFFYNAGLPAGQSFGAQNWQGPAGEVTLPGTAKVRVYFELQNVSCADPFKLGLFYVMLSDDPVRAFSDDASIAANSAGITSEAVARAAADSALSTTINTVSTTVGGHTASLQLVASSVNGSSVYLGLIGNIDGVTGGLVLTGVGQNGIVSYNLYLSGNFILNGTLAASKIQTGALTSDSGVFGALSVKTLSIADNAVTVARAAYYSAAVGDTTNLEFCKNTLTIDTTGLAGKTLDILVQARAVGQRFSGGGTGYNLRLYVKQDGGARGILQGISRSLEGLNVEYFLIIHSFTVTGNSHTLEFGLLTNNSNSTISDSAVSAIGCKR